ncbi:UNVERIFIED_CONTAM: hypothetical protein K2H54_042913 [Gekko kuhli]
MAGKKSQSTAQLWRCALGSLIYRNQMHHRSAPPKAGFTVYGPGQRRSTRLCLLFSHMLRPAKKKNLDSAEPLIPLSQNAWILKSLLFPRHSNPDHKDKPSATTFTGRRYNFKNNNTAQNRCPKDKSIPESFFFF